MSTLKAKQTAFAAFDRLGEDYVRLSLSSPPSGTSAYYKLRRSWMTEWLAQFEKDSRLRNEASQSESLETAKSAKNAAWEAARQAKNANTLAALALTAAVIAIAISIVGIFLG